MRRRRRRGFAVSRMERIALTRGRKTFGIHSACRTLTSRSSLPSVFRPRLQSRRRLCEGGFGVAAAKSGSLREPTKPGPFRVPPSDFVPSPFRNPKSLACYGRPTHNRRSMTNLKTILKIASRQLPAEGVDCLLVGGFAAALSVLHNLDLESDIRPLCSRFGTSAVYDLIRGQVEALRTP